MPTLHPCDDRASDFSSLISDRLATLELSLAEGCERIAKEREASLREENKQLQQENEELRLRLTKIDSKTVPSGNIQADPADVETSIVPLKSADATAPADDADCDAAEKSGKIIPNFRLLPEFTSDTWVDQGVKEVGDLGYYNRDGPEISDGVSYRSCIVDPSSTFRLCWDILGIPILSWDLITIPLGVFTIGKTGDDLMMGAGWVTLIYWTLDLPFTFLTGFFDNEGTLIMEFREIARHYMRGFFGLDMIIILADWLSVIMGLIGSGAPSFLSNVSVLRIFRITRFVRLMRLRKLKAKIQTIEDGINSEWLLVIMNLCGKIFSIMMINHYVCCVWYWLGTQDIFSPETRWISAMPYPQYDHHGHKLIEAEWHYQYFTSLHWAIAQFTPGPQNIQPQNSLERVFAVIVLMFGLVIFSSFIAGVTQARMQLNKMMSKLDRDLWILRKFCQQHTVSRELTIRMKRYIDLVIVPNFHKLNVSDVVLIPKLSAHLRSQLNNELVSQVICVHPFFAHLRRNHDGVMNCVSNSCLENFSLARGDVAFGSGQVGKYMLLVANGVLEYIPIDHQGGADTDCCEAVAKGRWVSEAVLWTKWVHQGQMQASIESSAMLIDGAKLRGELLKNGLVMTFVRRYSRGFIERLNEVAQAVGGCPSDLHDEISTKIPIAMNTRDLSDAQPAPGFNAATLLPRLMQ